MTKNKAKLILIFIVFISGLYIAFFRMNYISALNKTIIYDFIEMDKIAINYTSDTDLEYNNNNFIIYNEKYNLKVNDDTDMNIIMLKDEEASELLEVLSSLKLSLNFTNKLDKDYFIEQSYPKYKTFSILDINTGYKFNFRIIELETGEIDVRYFFEGGLVSKFKYFGEKTKNSYDINVFKVDSESSEKLNNILQKY